MWMGGGELQRGSALLMGSIAHVPIHGHVMSSRQGWPIVTAAHAGNGMCRLFASSREMHLLATRNGLCLQHAHANRKQGSALQSCGPTLQHA